MNKTALLLAGILMIFIFTTCDTTETYVKNNSQETAKPGTSADNSTQTSSQTKEEETNAQEPTYENDQSLDNDTVALIGKYVLTREKYKIITDYMSDKYQYTLTPEQEKEFLNFIINKKLMAMDAREKDYDKRKDIQVKYEWDFDDLLSHAYYMENVENKSKVTDKEAKEYYSKHADDFVQVKAAHILVKDKDEAESLYKRIQAGESFLDIAKKYSIDQTTKDSGGDLGYFQKDTMVKEFEDAAFSMSKDEISEPIKTVYGYHIIKILDRKNFTFDESKDKIIKIIEDTKKQEVFDKLMDKLRAKYRVILRGNSAK